MSTPTRPAGAPAPGTFGTAGTFGTFLRWGTMGTKRRSFLPFLSFPSFLSFQSFLPFLPLETFLSFFSFLPLETFQSFLTFLSFHTGKTFLSFLSFQACLALSVTALKRRATSPVNVGGSPLRHSPLARPVPPLPHAGEANVTCRLQPPTFTGEVARRAGEGKAPILLDGGSGFASGLRRRSGQAYSWLRYSSTISSTLVSRGLPGRQASA